MSTTTGRLRAKNARGRALARRGTESLLLGLGAVGDSMTMALGTVCVDSPRRIVIIPPPASTRSARASVCWRAMHRCCGSAGGVDLDRSSKGMGWLSSSRRAHHSHPFLLEMRIQRSKPVEAHNVLTDADRSPPTPQRTHAHTGMEPASTAPGSARPRRPRQHPCSAGWMLAGAAMGVVSLACGAEGAAVAGCGYSSGRARALPAVGPAAFIQRAPGPVAGRSWALPRHHQHQQHQQHRCGAPVARGSGMWRRKPWPFELAPLAASDADAGATDTEPSSLMTTLRDKVLFGVEPSPDVAAILTVYFVQGAIGA